MKKWSGQFVECAKAGGVRAPARNAPVAAATSGTKSIGVAAGFTLTELIVAVAAVALLSVGIGQLFSSVGKLVGGGAAVAETNQFARALSRQMSDDFEALNAMREEDTFIAIRNRRLGDFNRNGSLDAGETAIYLNQNDRELDVRAGILPYAPGSRAISVRLDEIMFLAAGGEQGAFPTAQQLGVPLVPPVVVGGRIQSPPPTPSAQVARIYYGHGLKPVPDRAFDRDNPPNGSNVPRRFWVADGYFGTRAGQDRPYDTLPGSSTTDGGLSGVSAGRNEYAAEWVLARQALLLYGGNAAGYKGSTPNVVSAPFNEKLAYTPFIRGLEAEETVRNPPVFWTGGVLNDTSPNQPDRGGVTRGPFAKLMRHGRVDICAQSPQEAQRWLEGLEPPPAVPGQIRSDATAFETGKLDELAGDKWDEASGDAFGSRKIDAPLWMRDGTPNAQALNSIGLRSAIAGCFQRLQVEASPAYVDRGDSLQDNSLGSVNGRQGVDPPEFAYMDTHAALGTHISSMEIAWSDGLTWVEDQDLDLDANGPEPIRANRRAGDVLWYDMEFARYNVPGSARCLKQQDPSGRYTSGDPPQWLNPEVTAGKRGNQNMALNINSPGHYDPFNTGGDLTVTGDSEYLAIFPYRVPDGAGDYGQAFQKPKLIRIRFTVHDAQLRIAGGRTYEFLFGINLK